MSQDFYCLKTYADVDKTESMFYVLPICWIYFTRQYFPDNIFVS